MVDTEDIMNEDEWWEAVNASYARLRTDPIASVEYDAEMALWDATLLDGLKEWPYEGIDELLAAIDARDALTAAHPPKTPE
jgi:hypothetical protein